MPYLGSRPGICLPLALGWLYPLITDTNQLVTLSSSPRTPAHGGRPLLPSGGTWTSVHYWTSSIWPPWPIQSSPPSPDYGLGEMWKNSVVTLSTYLFPPKMGQCQTGCMAFTPYGWTCMRPGSPLWMKWLGNWLPWSPVDPIGLTPWCGSMGKPTMYPPQGGAPEHPDWRRHQ